MEHKNNFDHKKEVVNKVVNDAEAKIKQKDAPEENVELKLEAGVVYASLDGLITTFKLNSRRQGLSNAERGIFTRMINVLETYRTRGLEIGQLDENSQFFYSGEKIIYVGGQLETEAYDKSGARLEANKEYTVFDNRKGLVADKWLPVVTLEEFPGATPEERPGFLITMFRKKPKEETKVVQMGASLTKDNEAAEQAGQKSMDEDEIMSTGSSIDELREDEEDGPSPDYGMDSPES